MTSPAILKYSASPPPLPPLYDFKNKMWPPLYGSRFVRSWQDTHPCYRCSAKVTDFNNTASINIASWFLWWVNDQILCVHHPMLGQCLSLILLPSPSFTMLTSKLLDLGLLGLMVICESGNAFLISSERELAFRLYTCQDLLE